MLLGIVDYISEPEIAILYIAPIALSAWYAGQWAGAVVALISSGIWLYDDFLTRYTGTTTFAPYWEAAVRLGFFLIISFILARLHGALRSEKELSRTDDLTKIANGRHFNEMLGFELEKLRRYERPLTVAYMDVDNFKTVNDRFGHSAGDKLLYLIADTLRKNTRSTDMPARLGGDEFGILLPETGYDQAKNVIAKIHQQLSKAIDLKKYPVTFSIGAVSFHVAPLSIDEAIRIADELMYAVKKSGKNMTKVERFSREKELASVT